MGSGISILNLSVEDVAKGVTSLGEVYEEYGQLMITNSIDGAVLNSMSDEAEIMSALKDIGIAKAIHQRVICTHFTKIRNGYGATNANIPCDSARSTVNNVEVVLSSLVVQQHITMTPRAIMTQLFSIQGIKLDPSDLESALGKLIATVKTGFGDGVTTYDCFLNYRVASDVDVAEKLYWMLKASGIHAFFDKMCLTDGMPWKEAFLQGLRNSHSFVAIISSAGLKCVRDYACDHGGDNVLLEYETALNIWNLSKSNSYIVPVLVGALSSVNGVQSLSKFSDFSPAIYPDSISACEVVRDDSGQLEAGNINSSSTSSSSNARTAPASITHDDTHRSLSLLGVVEQANQLDTLPSIVEFLHDNQKSSNANAVAAALGSVNRMCQQDNEAALACAQAPGFLALIISAVTQHYSTYDVALQGLLVMNSMNYTPESWNVFGQAGACEMLVHIAQSHGTDAAVAENALKCITKISVNDDNCVLLGSCNGCESVVAVLKLHEMSSLEVCNEGLKAILNLTTGNPTNQTKMGLCGGCEVVLNILIHHANQHIGIAENGLRVLLNLCTGHAENRVKLGTIGACKVTVDLLKFIGPTNIIVCEMGLKSMCNLAIDKTNRITLGNLDACHATAQMMKIYLSGTDVDVSAKNVVALHGSWAVVNLISACPDNIVKFQAEQCKNLLQQQVIDNDVISDEHAKTKAIAAIAKL